LCGVCNYHEGGRFFVPDLDEFAVTGPLQRAVTPLMPLPG
jgi:hypothetical protein